MLEPQWLQNFLHVMNLGSLSLASQKAHVTQPALSRQMRLLEEHLEVSLFERTGRGMHPTSDARRLQERALPLLRQWESIAEDFAGETVRGTVTLAVTPSIGWSWVATVVEAFSAAHPDAKIQVI